tara:strand:- start:110 stop:235 length:126 start_codon:yes stop_codon:yes gene_type:complete
MASPSYRLKPNKKSVAYNDNDDIDVERKFVNEKFIFNRNYL